MSFTLSTFKLLINNFDQNIKSICSNLDIQRQGKFPSVIGKFGQNLLATYKQMDATLEQSDTPYVMLAHKDEHDIATITKIHKKARVKYKSFPAIFNEHFPNYNAQIIHQSSENNKIVVMEGPSDQEAAMRMFKDMLKNGITKIFALGKPDAPTDSHFGYYTQASLQSEELTISSTKQEIEANKHLAVYDLNIQDNKTTHSTAIKVYHIDIEDGGTLELSINELEEIYNTVKSSGAAFHCSAGRGRASILSLALMLSMEDVFSGDNLNEQHYSNLFLSACKKRIGLCQKLSQFDQIYTLALAFTAFRYDLKATDFPTEFFSLPGAPKQGLSKVTVSKDTYLAQPLTVKPSFFSSKATSCLISPVERQKPTISGNNSINKIPIIIPKRVKA
jgi:hypothetical protein